MNNLIELKTEETKAVVGGLAERKGPPPFIRAFEQAGLELIAEITGRGRMIQSA
jgi:hypothetical protein